MLFPQKCGICKKISNNILCEECRKIIENEIEMKEEKLEKMYFQKHIYFARYKGIIKNKILQYKFKDKVYLYKFFCEIIKINKKKYEFFKKYDIIIPVPIHYYRKIKRGYNQSELIVREIEKTKVIKMEKSVLIRNKKIKPQSKLNKEQRKININNAYKVKNKEKILNKKCLIFDDIYTTGSTVNECAKVLVQAGAQSVDVITIVKT